MADKNKPELIEDEDLEEASGGLLPAVQKNREAAARLTSSSDPAPSSTDASTGNATG